ncbi:MAG: glycosyltransferase family 2 protein [Thermoanaerobaculum sp.]|nr:glycosyltransferase family 2 protein [Thermoanaerobaculum sp.]MDW7968780.1 glycosyltransferase family 2 protein [Thermoanaerobaculum sp.]
MKAAAVVINHNGGNDLGRCLAALQTQTVPVEVVLVDCHSTDASRAWVEAPPAGVRVVALQTNRGYTGGANAGLEAVGQEVEVVGFFNPDCFPRRDFFATCLQVFAQRPEVGGIAPRLLREDEATLDSCGQVLSPWVLMVRDRGFGEPAAGRYLEGERVLAACGAGMVFRRAALAQVQVGGEVFPADFFAFWEDLDLGWRVSASGWVVCYEPQAVAIHRRGATARAGEGRLLFRRPPPLVAGYLCNRWATLIRNLHWADAWWRLPLLVVWDTTMLAAVALRMPQALAYLPRSLGRVGRAWRVRRLWPKRRLRELLP